MNTYHKVLKQYLTACRKRRDRARALARQGVTYAAIGKELGVTRQRVYAMLRQD
jgi:DNA-directed RNA polymerase sigma subunit (sigma70/sigma32)